MNGFVVIVPLREGVHERVRALLDQGPPFDPGEAELHDVLLTEHEAIFSYESPSRSALERIVRDAKVLALATGWRDCVADRPRVAESVYSSTRLTGGDDLFFDATPGPGDSEGGDVYSP